MTDPIADMLTRIRNAALAKRSETVLPHSNIKEAIANILKNHGFLAGVSVSTVGGFKQLKLTLKTDTKLTLDRVSKPGRRIYASSKDIPTVMSGKGIVIISTPGGLMTGYEAKKRKLGGELICTVWA